MADAVNTSRRRGERRWLSDAFGAALRSQVAERNFDYRTLAERTGIDQGTLGRLSAGTRLPDLDTLFVLARGLDLTPESFVARIGVYSEFNALEHQVPIVFFRGPRIFRLVGSNGRERIDCYMNWLDAVRASAEAPDLFRAISIYSRTRIVELWESWSSPSSSSGS